MVAHFAICTIDKTTTKYKVVSKIKQSIVNSIILTEHVVCTEKYRTAWGLFCRNRAHKGEFVQKTEVRYFSVQTAEQARLAESLLYGIRHLYLK